MHLGEFKDVFWMGRQGGGAGVWLGMLLLCWRKGVLAQSILYWRSRGRGCIWTGLQKTGDPKAGCCCVKQPKGKELCPAGGTCLLWGGHSCPVPSLDGCLWSWEPSVPLPYLWASAWGLETVSWHQVLLSRWACAFVPAQVLQRGWFWCGISVIVASTEKLKEKHLQFFTTCIPFLFVAPIQHLSRCLPTKCSGSKKERDKSPTQVDYKMQQVKFWCEEIPEKSYLSLLKIQEGGAAEVLEGKLELLKEPVSGLSVLAKAFADLSLGAGTSWGV